MSATANLLEERSAKGPAAALITPTPDEDERLRGLIRAELDRQNAFPVARRTLELLAEAVSEPAPGSPGYRIVDRFGEMRLRPVTPEAAKKGEAPDVPLTLSDLVAELRGRHPELFGEPPRPEPEPPPEPEPNTAIQDTVAHVRVAGARFVETQSALARTLAARSAERGRALAAAAGETVGGWRAQIDGRLKTHRTPAPESSATIPEAQPSLPSVTGLSGEASATQPRRDWRAFGRDAVLRLKTGSTRMGEGARARFSRPADASPAPAASPPVPVEEGGQRRLAVIGLGGLTAVAAVAALVVVARQDTGTAPHPDAAASRQGETVTPAPPAQTPPPASSQANAPAPTLQDAAPAPQAASPTASPVDPEEQPEEAQPRNPNDVIGVPEVIDTATLRVSGKVIRLFGVEWVRGGQADELTKYLSRRTVTCQPAPGSSAHLCSVNGRDLSEVVLFNGGGRASPEAGPELVAAEDHARTERLGVWKR